MAIAIFSLIFLFHDWGCTITLLPAFLRLAPPATSLINIFSLNSLQFLRRKKNIIIYSPRGLGRVGTGERVLIDFVLIIQVCAKARKKLKHEGNCKVEIIIYKIS